MIAIIPLYMGLTVYLKNQIMIPIFPFWDQLTTHNYYRLAPC